MDDEWISAPNDFLHQYLQDSCGFKAADIAKHLGFTKGQYYKNIGNFGLRKSVAEQLAEAFRLSVGVLFPNGFYRVSDFPATDEIPMYSPPTVGMTFEDYCDAVKPIKYCLKHWLKIQRGEIILNQVPQVLAFHKIKMKDLALALGVTRVRRQLSPATNYGLLEAVKLYRGVQKLCDVSFTDLFPEGCIEPLEPILWGYRHTCDVGAEDFLFEHDVSQCTGHIEDIKQSWQSILLTDQLTVTTLRHLKVNYPAEVLAEIHSNRGRYEPDAG